jgi:hypothetical protein
MHFLPAGNPNKGFIILTELARISGSLSLDLAAE